MKHIPYLDVDALVMEPQINNPPKKNDFAILTLKKPVEFGENIAPICLPHNPFRYYKDRVATLYGFGYNDTVEEIARHEKITNAVILKNSVCEVIMELQGRKIWEKGGFSEPHPRPYPLL